MLRVRLSAYASPKCTPMAMCAKQLSECHLCGRSFQFLFSHFCFVSFFFVAIAYSLHVNIPLISIATVIVGGDHFE